MSTSNDYNVEDSHLLNRTTSNRRSFLKRAVAVGVSVPTVATLLAACDPDEDTVDDAPPITDSDDDEEVAGDDDDAADDTETADGANGDRYGGSLNVAMTGDPPVMDVQLVTGATITLLGMHIWETLLTWDEDFEAVPELAESLNVSDDGLTVDIALREGVLFHNGEEMTAEDVIASIERWSAGSPRSSGFEEAHDELEAVDDYTIEIRMNEPLGALTTLLSRYAACCAIYPASIIEESGDAELSELIGTGPYEFVEFAPDQHFHVRRFEDYVGRDEDPSGYAGRKHQYLDDIYFIPVPDEAARVAGLQAGDLDYLDEVSPDQFETIDSDPNSVAQIPPPHQPGAWVMNMQEGILSNQTMRQALQAAVDCEAMLLAGYGEDFATLDPSIVLRETAFHTTAGEEYYNQADPDRARELAEEAGYNGEPIRIMTSTEREPIYNMTLVSQQQFEDAGFNIDLQTMDGATLSQRRDDPADWDMFTTNFGFFPDPIMIPNVAGTSWSGWWDTERKNELVRQFVTESDFEARFAIWEELQALAYEEVPQINIGHASMLIGYSTRLQNAPEYTQQGASFWNSWLE